MRTVLTIMLVMFLANPAVAVRSVTSSADRDLPAGRSITVPTIWHNDIDAALALAQAEYRPVLVFFSSPDCTWCSRLKTDVLNDPETLPLLQHFCLVEIDVTRDERAAVRFQIRGVPSILILSGDGRVRNGVGGYLTGPQFRDMLKAALNPEFLRKSDSSFVELLSLLDSGNVPADKWPEIMLALGSKEKRKELHDRILAITPFPRKQIVALLKDDRIAVRLGALEIIEELTSNTFSFDPWLDEDSQSSNVEALEKWQNWAGSETNVVEIVYSSMTPDLITSYIRDLISENSERSVRAMRMLEQGGGDTVKAISDFLAKNPHLPQGAKRKIKEVEYTLLIPRSGGIEPSMLAHRLVYGTLDIRLKSILSLQATGKRGVTVLKEFLQDPDSIIRETAVDALVFAGGKQITKVLADHLEEEKDPDVVYAILRGLGKTRSKTSLDILVSYLTNENEDLVIAALGSIAKLKSKTVEKEMATCLDDPRWRVRVAALETIGKIKLSKLESRVTSMLDDKDDFVRYTTIKTLTSISSKKARPKLEEVFMREDRLKGPVVAAFGSMDIPIPDTFAEELKNKKPDVLLSVIEALEDCSVRDVRIVHGLVNHKSLDVSCAAIRLIGSRGMTLPQYRAMFVKILKRSGSSQKKLAALESMELQKESLSAYRMLYAHWFLEEQPTQAQQPAEDTLQTVVDAFGEETPDKTPAPDTGASHDRETEIVQDILAAFSDPARSESQRNGSIPTLIEAIETCLGPENDDRTRFAAAGLLAGLGNPGVLPFMNEGLSKRTVQQRVNIASSLSHIVRNDALPLLRKLLNDPSERVRAAAAESCFEHAARSEFIDAVFEELVRDKAVLKPHEIFGYQLENVAQNALTKRLIRKWIRKIIVESRAVELQNLALILLEKSWGRGDEKIAKRFLDSQNVWQRRAAFHAFGKGNPTKFRSVLSKAATDSSEHVRKVVPSVLTRSSSTWVHYFDDKHFDMDSYYWSRSGSKSPSLTPEITESLLELTRDVSPAVRMEAFFCLLSHRATIDLADFMNTADSLPDREAVNERIADYVTENYRKLGQGFAALLPYVEASGRDESALKKVLAHFNIDPDKESGTFEYLARTEKRTEIPATFLEVEDTATATNDSATLMLVYFTSPGCSDCARVEKLFVQLKEHFPGLKIETHNIKKVAAMRLNEALSERFGVPEAVRLVTPAVFSGGGYLIKSDVDFARLGRLMSKSTAVPEEQWYAIEEKDLAAAEESIARRYESLTLLLTVGFGLIDGVNPCAFATIIFLLSYLQIARRSPNQIAAVALAFIAAVYLAYFFLGLGLASLISEIMFLEKAGKFLKWGMAFFAFIIMTLSIRDGIRCLHGRIEDMTLQLPDFLKRGVRTVIRTGARQSHFVIAAFVVGIIVSFLEFACTGQTYLPTIGFILEARGPSAGVLGMIALYDAAFVLPLFIIFLLAYFGMKSEALTVALHRHAALVKFCTAGLFLVLVLFFLFGDIFLAAIR
jgi:HEAT repeat protein/thioredoxin-related protein